MNLSEVLEQTWKQVLDEEPQEEGIYYRRLAVTSHWAIHVGIRRPASTFVLILETEKVAADKFRYHDDSRGYSIEIGPDLVARPNRSTIRIIETDAAFRLPFTKFCADLIEHWCNQADAGAALRTLSLHLAKWRRFFQPGGELGLSRDEYIGLFGELAFMDAAIRYGIEVFAIVDAWHGQDATNQDFLFGKIAAEIKTATGNDSDRIYISNVRQLDGTGLERLFLARYAFDFRQGSGKTLPQLVSGLRSKIFSDSQAAGFLFSDRLSQAGFIDSCPHALDQWGFTLRNFSMFEVRDGFPRITEESIPEGISGLKYELNLAAATNYRIAEAIVWATIAASHG